MAGKAIQQDRYRLSGTYERLRRGLLESPDEGRLDKSLSYWVLPTDRRLPIAFLDRSLRDLLSRPLDELMSTPGVGQKKILGFFDLLRRAAKTTETEGPFGLGPSDIPASHRSLPFEAAAVSEAVWSSWCETVRAIGFQNEKLGRLAPSLQSLPTVIWHARLGDYSELSLAEMRRLRTHGEKRIRAILEVFCVVHEAVSTATLHENVDVTLSPRFVPVLNRWLTEVVWEPILPSVDDLRRSLVNPMVHQLQIDIGAQVAQLASDRLRSSGGPSVKLQAEALGVTRARVYQLLEDCAKVMEVRWPEGRWLLAPLAHKIEGSCPESVGLVHAACELFLPDERALPSMSPVKQRRSQDA